jgi:hypothetical protein
VATDSSIVPARRSHLDAVDALLAVLLAVSALTLILFLILLPARPHRSDKRDYVICWATAQQLVHRANPYDSSAIAKVERQAGYRTQDFTLRNPPWILPLVVPLGFVTAPQGSVPWSLLMLAVLALSVWLIPGVCGEHPDKNRLWIGLCFPFALQCAMVGQTSILVLLGIALFLRLVERHPFPAGAALWFCSLKGHILLPFAAVLLVWIITRRQWRVLFGFASALAAGCLLTVWIDPAAFSQYLSWTRASGIRQEYIPSLSYWFRQWIDPGAFWLSFLPCSLACMGALIWFWRRRRTWDWLEDGSLLLVVSIVVAPYSWIFDQSIAIPALLWSSFRVRSRFPLALLAAAYLFIDLEPFYTERHLGLFNVLPPIFWLLWCWWARRSPSKAPALTSLPVCAS